jgi:hypothetical protein
MDSEAGVSDGVRYFLSVKTNQEIVPHLRLTNCADFLFFFLADPRSGQNAVQMTQQQYSRTPRFLTFDLIMSSVK